MNMDLNKLITDVMATIDKFDKSQSTSVEFDLPLDFCTKKGVLVKFPCESSEYNSRIKFTLRSAEE